VKTGIFPIFWNIGKLQDESFFYYFPCGILGRFPPSREWQLILFFLHSIKVCFYHLRGDICWKRCIRRSILFIIDRRRWGAGDKHILRQILYHVSHHWEDKFGRFCLYRIDNVLSNVRIGREAQVIVPIDDESQQSKFYDELKYSPPPFGSEHPVHTVNLFGIGEVFFREKHIQWVRDNGAIIGIFRGKAKRFFI